MNTGQEEKAMNGKRYRVFRAFGQEFPVYCQSSGKDKRTIPNCMFPHFDSEAHPFMLAVKECCSIAPAQRDTG